MAGGVDVSNYDHLPVHKAIATKDYDTLQKLLLGVPRLSNPAQVRTEADSLAEEEKADAISAVIDRRDNVPNRDTPLHLAVKLGDETATKMLMIAGADCTLQNEQGWNALQEAICDRQEVIAKIIVQRYHPLSWAKWCRRLPRLVATMKRMRDFYMEITFHFESSVIPFISRIAPSDTYKIWKRGANLRADMTLAGFDGFRIQRSDQSILFLGEGSEDGKLPPGSLCIVSHKDKEITSALDGAGGQPWEADVQQEVTSMSKTNMFRPGIDVTEAILLPQLTWRRQEKEESVGQWKAKVYEMHNVVVSIRSRKVPGAMTDDEFFSSSNGNEIDGEELNEILTDEEKKQLELALNSDSYDNTNEGGDDGIIGHRHSSECRDIPIEDENGHKNVGSKHEKKGWFGGWRKQDRKYEGHNKPAPLKSSLSVDETTAGVNVSASRNPVKPGRHSVDVFTGDESHKGRDKNSSSSGNVESKDATQENEYKKGLRPILWLSSDSPLRTEELLPLLDILANKVKAIRRLRELLATKLPMGTFPVKVAIPVIPTIRVLVTSTKFEELQPLEEFSTPPSSPTSSSNESPAVTNTSSSSWFRWMKAPYHRSTLTGDSSSSNKIENGMEDPFTIPLDYVWLTAEAKKKKMEEKNRAKKAKGKDQPNRGP